MNMMDQLMNYLNCLKSMYKVLLSPASGTQQPRHHALKQGCRQDLPGGGFGSIFDPKTLWGSEVVTTAKKPSVTVSSLRWNKAQHHHHDYCESDGIPALMSERLQAHNKLAAEGTSLSSTFHPHLNLPSIILHHHLLPYQLHCGLMLHGLQV